MNYAQTLLCILLSSTLMSNAMKKQCTPIKKDSSMYFDNSHVDFSIFHAELGSPQGAREANHVLAHSTDVTDILRPLLTEMTQRAAHLDEHTSTTINHLKGFFTGFALVLYKYNVNHPDKPIKIESEVFTKKMADFQKGINSQKQKNREEVVKLLTASLTDKQILTLN